MVTRWGSEAGKSRVGCLFMLLLLAAGSYFGVHYFEVWFRYYRIQDEVKTEAQYASTISDDVIRRRLVAGADTLGLALGPDEWDIRRSVEPREIMIHAEYVDSVVLEIPGFRKVFYFRFTPGTRAPI